MASLTETAYYSRQAIKYGGVGFLVLLIVWWTGTGLVNLWIATHPEPPPPPAASFGLLPAIEFPQSQLKTASFRLETPTGQLGTFPDRLKVFVAPSKRSTFLAADNANTLARKLGFAGPPTLETSTLYRWTVPVPLPSTLEMDIINTHFVLQRTWQADPSLVTNKRFISDQQAILDARNFLSAGGLVVPDIQGQEKITYLRAQGDQLIPAISLSEADFVRVDFFRALYAPPIIAVSPTQAAPSPATTQSYAFYTPDPKRGLISTIVSGSDAEDRKIISVDYRYTPIEYESFSDYPLKPIQSAWEELNSSQGFIASFTGSNTAVVRRIALGYFDPLTPHEYVMPIYIFSGDNDFVAYVSAVDQTLIEPAP